MNNIINSAVFLLSSSIVGIIAFFKLTNVNIQQIILAIIVILVISSRFVSKEGISFWLKILWLFLSSLLVQLIIISTGHILSPLFILLHLYIIGLALFINFRAALFFLILASVSFFVVLLNNPVLKSLISQDLGSVSLYLASILTTIPLSFFVSKQYALKGVILSSVLKQLNTESYILEQISELIFVTDKNLRVIAANESALKALKLSKSEIAGQIITKLLNLSDVKGKSVSEEVLALKKDAYANASYIIKDNYLQLPTRKRPIKVLIKIKPLTDEKKEVEQVTFVFSEEKESGLSEKDIDSVQKKYLSLITSLENSPILSKLPNLRIQLILLEKLEQDLVAAYELEHQSIKLEEKLTDLAESCHMAIKNNQALSQVLGKTVKLSLGEENVQEATRLKLIESGAFKDFLDNSNYYISTDSRLFNLLLEKLIQISLLLSLKSPEIKMNIFLESKSAIKLTTSFISLPLTDEEQKDILVPNYGKLLAKTNLKYGSGLEGVIAKDIANLLNIPLQINFNKFNATLNFTLLIPTHSGDNV